MALWTNQDLDIPELDPIHAEDPEAFTSDILGVPLWDKFCEILWGVAKNPKVAVRGCYGSGKTFALACVVLWFLCTRYGSRVVTSAPTDRQVRDLLWMEVGKLHARARVCLGGICDQERYKIRPDWFGVGFTANKYNENAFQGYHAPQILFGLDETCGVPTTFYDAADRFLVGDDDRFVTIGNATDRATRFGESFSDPTFCKIRISAYDTPNVKEGKVVIPGMVTLTWVRDKEAKWLPDSAPFLSKVLAEFPLSADDDLFAFHRITQANEQWKLVATLIEQELHKPEGDKWLGVDVARGESDHNAFVWRQGLWVPRTLRFLSNDLEQVADRIQVEAEKGWIPCIDVIGLGAGVYDILRRRQVHCLPCMGSEKSEKKDETGTFGFANKRAEWYWAGAQLVKDPEAALPEDDYLCQDLTVLKWREVPGGRIAVTPKEDVLAKLGRSPDTGDAFAYTFAAPRMHGATIISKAPATKAGRYTMRGDYSRRKGSR